jgi:hypothetical protein
MLIILAFCPLALTACMTTDEDPYPNIKIVDAQSVASCKLNGNISTSSTTPYGLFTETANDATLNMAKKEAYKLGANRVVLDEPARSGDTITMNGHAYSCQ